MVAPSAPRLRDAPAIIATNLAVLVAWVFFRAETFSQAGDVLSGIVTLRDGPVDGSDVLTVALFALATLAVDLLQRFRIELPVGSSSPAVPLLRGAAVGTVLAAIVLFSGGTPVPFIYFQF